MWSIFFSEFQCLPVNDCSAVSCDSGALARGSKCRSFYSAILNQSLEILIAGETLEEWTRSLSLSMIYSLGQIPVIHVSESGWTLLLRTWKNHNRVADRVLVLQPGVRPEHLRWETQVQDIGPPETSRPHVISNSESSPRDLQLKAKTQLYSTTSSKLQCRTPYAKQQARQAHNPTHRRKAA